MKKFIVWMLIVYGIFFTAKLVYILKPWYVLYFFIDNVPKSVLSGFDYRFFYDTEGWDLADACRDNDSVRIEKLLNNSEFDVNFDL